jgi:hypothetical protein
LELRLKYMAIWLFLQGIVIMVLAALVLKLNVLLMTCIGLAGGSAQAVTTYVIWRCGLTEMEW